MKKLKLNLVRKNKFKKMSKMLTYYYFNTDKFIYIYVYVRVSTKFTYLLYQGFFFKDFVNWVTFCNFFKDFLYEVGFLKWCR